MKDLSGFPIRRLKKMYSTKSEQEISLHINQEVFDDKPVNIIKISRNGSLLSKINNAIQGYLVYDRGNTKVRR